MSNFILSAFADEIDPSLDIQMEVLRKFSISHIEMRGVDGKNVSEYTPEEMKQIKKRLDENGFSVSAVGSPIGKIEITDDMDAQMVLFRNVMELAKILETPYIRLFSFFMPKGEDPAKYRDEVLRRMNQYVTAAKGSGLILLHENEKNIYGDTAERCLDIVESIGSDQLRVTFDPANFVECNEETYPKAYHMLRPYLTYMHIKDCLRGSYVVPAGQGDGNVEQILRELSSSGYRGFLSLEPHLTYFAGLGALEKEKRFEDETAGDGQAQFAMAVNALNAILNKI